LAAHLRDGGLTAGSAKRSAAAVAALVAAALGAGVLTAPSAAAGIRAAHATRAAASGGTWGTAEEVPGTAVLNQGGVASINSVSCPSAGNCSAGGNYVDSSSDTQAFVINETNGSWSQAMEVPGTAALNKGGIAVISSVSCRSAGNCSAGGDYTDSSNHQQALVVSEVNGTWGTAVELPGIAKLNAGGSAAITSLSCASAGNCSAGGPTSKSPQTRKRSS
jgi:hypothetical protein